MTMPAGPWTKYQRPQNPDPRLFEAVRHAESGADPNAISPVGAIGTMQTMPDTLRDPGYGVEPLPEDQWDDPMALQKKGEEYLSAMYRKYGGDTEAALIAYNAGPRNADKWLKAGRDYSVLPKREETEPYVQKVMARYEAPQEEGPWAKYDAEGPWTKYQAQPAVTGDINPETGKPWTREEIEATKITPAPGYESAAGSEAWQENASSAEELSETYDGLWESVKKAVQNAPESFIQAGTGLTRFIFGQEDPQVKAEALEDQPEMLTMQQMALDMGWHKYQAEHGLKPLDVEAYKQYLMSKEATDRWNNSYDKKITEWAEAESADAAAEMAANMPNPEPGSVPFYASQIVAGAIDMAPTVIVGALTKNVNAAQAMMGTQIFGRTYDVALQEGKTEDEATTDAFFTTAVETLTERIPLKWILDEGKTGLKGILASAGAEAIQEPLTVLAEYARDVWNFSEDATMGEVLEKIAADAPQLLLDLRDAAIIGAGVGAVLKTGTEAARKVAGSQRAKAKPVDPEVYEDPGSVSAEALAEMGLEERPVTKSMLDRAAEGDPLTDEEMMNLVRVGAAKVINKNTENQRAILTQEGRRMREQAAEEQEEVLPGQPTPRRAVRESAVNNKALKQYLQMRSDVAGKMGNFDITSEGKAIGYKVMRLDDQGRARSFADSRQTVNLEEGAEHALSGKGVFVSNDPQYVLDYYSSREFEDDPREVLIEYEFDPANITFGNMDDSQPEIAVSNARVRRVVSVDTLKAIEQGAGGEPPDYVEQAVPEVKMPIIPEGQIVAPLDRRERDYDIPNVYRDNPGGDWLEGQQRRADERLEEGFKVGGDVTAGVRIAYLDIDVAASLPGQMDEHLSDPRGRDPRRYDELAESITEKGFDVGLRPLIVVNHKGEAYVNEGNRRIAIAKKLGLPSVPVEIRYFAGGENAEGPLKLSKLEEAAEPVRYARRRRRSRAPTGKFWEERYPTVGQRPVGAPARIKTLQDVKEEVRSLTAEIEREAEGAPQAAWQWYEQAGETIRRISRGDRQMMEQQVRIMAKLSQAASVGANVTWWVEGNYQLARGEPLRISRFPNEFQHDIKPILEASTMSTDVKGVNDKLMSFYRNLRDATFEENLWPEEATMDRWMFRLLGYSAKKETFQTTQYDFARKIFQDATAAYNKKHGTNYLPRQVQALMWAYIRGGDTGSMQGYLNRATAEITAEAVPSRSLIDGLKISNLSAAQKDRMTEEIFSIFKVGKRNKILDALDIPLYYEGITEGAYEGVVTPGRLTGVTLLKVPKIRDAKGRFISKDKRTTRVYDRDTANLISDIYQYILRQDAVIWYRPDSSHGANSKGYTNAVSITFDEPLSDLDLSRFAEDFTALVPEVKGFTRVDDRTIEAVNVGRAVKTKDWERAVDHGIKLTSNRYNINTTVNQDGTPKEGATAFLVVEDSGLREHNWKEDPHGKALENRLRKALGPEVFKRIRDWRARAEAVAKRYARRQDTFTRGVASSVPVDRLRASPAAEQEIYGRFGRLNPGSDTTRALKIYPRASDEAIQELLDDLGFEWDWFSFEESRFKIPRLKKEGYAQGKVWIYDPYAEHGSFKDPVYTKGWRIPHEIGHGLTEGLLTQQGYGESYRYGRLGRHMYLDVGKPPNRIKNRQRPMTLLEAQRAVEWEDLAFRAQKMLMERMGHQITPEMFAREYNTNIADAMYRSLTGEFGNPGSIGFDPHTKRMSLKQALTALEKTEQELAKAQGRTPTKGVNLDTWKPISDAQIRAAIDGRLAEKQKPAVEEHALENEMRISVNEDGDVVIKTPPKFSRRAEPEKSFAQRYGKNVEAFFEEWMRATEPNPLGARERVIDWKAAADIRPYDKGTVALDSLRAFEFRKGDGGMALRRIIQLADRHGVRIHIYPKAFGEGGMTTEQLVDWYKANGWEWQKGGGWIREPQTTSTFRKLRRPMGSTKGIGKEAVQDAVRPVFRVMNSAPAVRVVGDINEIPPNLLDRVIEEAKKGKVPVSEALRTTLGIYDRFHGADTVYLIGNNINNKTEAVETLLHEIVGHYGLQGVIPPAYWRDFMIRVRKSFPKEVIAAAERNGLNMAKEDHALVAAEEFIAYTAQRILNGETFSEKIMRVIDDLIRVLRNLIRAATGGQAVMTKRQILQVINESWNFVHRPGGYKHDVINMHRRMRRAARANWAYSAVAKWVDEEYFDKKPQKPDTILQNIKAAVKRGKIKEEELNWMGLIDWLEDGPTNMEIAHLSGMHWRDAAAQNMGGKVKEKNDLLDALSEKFDEVRDEAARILFTTGRDYSELSWAEGELAFLGLPVPEKTYFDAIFGIKSLRRGEIPDGLSAMTFGNVQLREFAADKFEGLNDPRGMDTFIYNGTPKVDPRTYGKKINELYKTASETFIEMEKLTAELESMVKGKATTISHDALRRFVQSKSVRIEVTNPTVDLIDNINALSQGWWDKVASDPDGDTEYHRDYFDDVIDFDERFKYLGLRPGTDIESHELDDLMVQALEMPGEFVDDNDPPGHGFVGDFLADVDQLVIDFARHPLIAGERKTNIPLDEMRDNIQKAAEVISEIAIERRSVDPVVRPSIFSDPEDGKPTSNPLLKPWEGEPLASSDRLMEIYGALRNAVQKKLTSQIPRAWAWNADVSTDGTYHQNASIRFRLWGTDLEGYTLQVGGPGGWQDITKINEPWNEESDVDDHYKELFKKVGEELHDWAEYDETWPITLWTSYRQPTKVLTDPTTGKKIQASKNYEEVLFIADSSAHWEQHDAHFPDADNLLFWLRMEERLGPDGKWILYVDEMQSDWIQAARKQQADPIAALEIYTQHMQFSQEYLDNTQHQLIKIAHPWMTDPTNMNSKVLVKMMSNILVEDHWVMEQERQEDFQYYGQKTAVEFMKRRIFDQSDIEKLNELANSDAYGNWLKLIDGKQSNSITLPLREYRQKGISADDAIDFIGLVWKAQRNARAGLEEIKVLDSADITEDSAALAEIDDLLDPVFDNSEAQVKRVADALQDMAKSDKNNQDSAITMEQLRSEVQQYNTLPSGVSSEAFKTDLLVFRFVDLMRRSATGNISRLTNGLEADDVFARIDKELDGKPYEEIFQDGVRAAWNIQQRIERMHQMEAAIDIPPLMNSYQQTALKYLISEATRRGMDRIAFANGEVHGVRWGHASMTNNLEWAYGPAKDLLGLPSRAELSRDSARLHLLIEKMNKTGPWPVAPMGDPSQLIRGTSLWTDWKNYAAENNIDPEDNDGRLTEWLSELDEPLVRIVENRTFSDPGVGNHGTLVRPNQLYATHGPKIAKLISDEIKKAQGTQETPRAQGSLGLDELGITQPVASGGRTYMTGNRVGYNVVAISRMDRFLKKYKTKFRWAPMLGGPEYMKGQMAYFEGGEEAAIDRQKKNYKILHLKDDPLKQLAEFDPEWNDWIDYRTDPEAIYKAYANAYDEAELDPNTAAGKRHRAQIDMRAKRAEEAAELLKDTYVVLKKRTRVRGGPGVRGHKETYWWPDEIAHGHADTPPDVERVATRMQTLVPVPRTKEDAERSVEFKARALAYAEDAQWGAWQLDLSDELKKTAEEEGFPLFARRDSRDVIPAEHREGYNELLESIQGEAPGGFAEWRARVQDIIEEEHKAANTMQMMVDQFYALKYWEKQLFGKLLPASYSSYKQAHFTTSPDSQLFAFLTSGAPEWRDGVTQLKEGTDGLLDVFRPVGDKIDDWGRYMVARRAKRLYLEGIGKEGSEGLLFNVKQHLERTRQVPFGKLADVGATEYMRGRQSQLEWIREEIWNDIIDGSLPAEIEGQIKRAGREQLLSPQAIASGLYLGEINPEFEEVAADYAAWQKALLDWAEEGGAIDGDTRPLWEHADYIPFYRVKDERLGPQFAEKAGITGARRGLANQAQPIKRLTGGKSQLGNPLENIMMNLNLLVQTTMRNRPAALAVENFLPSGLITEAKGFEHLKEALIPIDELKRKLRGVGIDPTDMPEVALRGMQKMWSIEAPSGPDVFSVLIKGKRKYFHAHDELLFRALTNINQRLFTSFLGRTMMAPFRGSKRLLTSMITLDPAFMGANWLRDVWMSYVNARHAKGVPAIPGAVKGIKQALTLDKEMLNIMAAGGAFYAGYINANDPGSAARSMRRAMRAEGINTTVLDSLWKLGNAYVNVAAAMENSNRIAHGYNKTMKETGSVAEAIWESKDLMNFAKHGDGWLMQLLTQTVPFMNARIQGTVRTGERSFFEGKHATGVTLAKGLLYTFITLAIYWMNRDDERYKLLPDEAKDLYWHFWIYGHHFAIPKSFEVGAIFGTVPERLWEFLESDADDKGKVALDRLGWIIREMFNMDPRQVQLVYPMVEAINNHNSFFDGPIVPWYLEKTDPAYQYTDKTSPTAREIAEILPDNRWWLPDFIESPMIIEHLIRGYMGTLGGYALQALDTAIRARSDDYGSAPKLRWDQLPIIKRFYKGWEPPIRYEVDSNGRQYMVIPEYEEGAQFPRRTSFENVLYELRSAAMQVERTVAEIRKDARISNMEDLDEYYLSQPSRYYRGITNEELLEALPLARATAESIKVTRKEIDEVLRDKEMDPAAKAATLENLYREIQMQAIEWYLERPGSGFDTNFETETTEDDVPEVIGEEDWKRLQNMTSQQTLEWLDQRNMKATAELVADVKAGGLR